MGCAARMKRRPDPACARRGKLSLSLAVSPGRFNGRNSIVRHGSNKQVQRALNNRPYLALRIVAAKLGTLRKVATASRVLEVTSVPALRKRSTIAAAKSAIANCKLPPVYDFSMYTEVEARFRLNQSDGRTWLIVVLWLPTAFYDFRVHSHTFIF